MTSISETPTPARRTRTVDEHTDEKRIILVRKASTKPTYWLSHSAMNVARSQCRWSFRARRHLENLAHEQGLTERHWRFSKRAQPESSQSAASWCPTIVVPAPGMSLFRLVGKLRQGNNLERDWPRLDH